MSKDYKEWISDRAEELARERYNQSYYDLPDSIQIELWTRAEADYIDREAARIDAAYDAWVEAHILAADDFD